MRVRKFFLLNANCKRRIFTERLANVTTTQGGSLRVILNLIRLGLLNLRPESLLLFLQHNQYDN